ncbi:MAG: hypothetical protein AAB553_03575 [Patescibacteria group bacterium]
MQKRTATPTPVTKGELEGVLDNYPTKYDLKEAFSDYPTKLYLKETLSDYPTKLDLKKALNDYPTKKDLSDRLTASQNALRAEMKYDFSLMKEDIMAEMSKFTNRVLTAIDPLLKELETRQQDRELATAQVKKIEERMETHDVRITKLERLTTAKTN